MSEHARFMNANQPNLTTSFEPITSQDYNNRTPYFPSAHRSYIHPAEFLKRGLGHISEHRGAERSFSPPPGGGSRCSSRRRGPTALLWPSRRRAGRDRPRPGDRPTRRPGPLSTAVREGRFSYRSFPSRTNLILGSALCCGCPMHNNNVFIRQVGSLKY